MCANLPSSDWEQQEQQQIKIIGGEDAQGTADEKVVGRSTAGAVFVLVAEQDGGYEIAAEDKEKRDEGAHFHGEGQLEPAQPGRVMIKEYTENGEEAETIQLWSIGNAWGALWRVSGHRIKIEDWWA